MGREATGRRWTKVLVCVALTAITLAAYWHVLDSGFVGFDDDYYVTRNPHVLAGPTGPSLAWAFVSMECSNWHPLTWVSHMIDCQLYGVNPTGHHLTALLIHLANVLLLFAVMQSLAGSRWRSAGVAALFAVHPLHVESVAWVAERKDVLSTLFWMLTLLAYAWYARKGGAKRYGLVVVLFAMGLMAKPMLVSLPFVLVILDWWPLRRGLASTWEKLPLLVLAGVSCVVTYVAQTGGLIISRLGDVPLSVRIDNALVSYVAYLCKTIWPAKLAVMYPHPLRSIPVWQVVGSAVALAGISAFVIAIRRNRPYALAGWLWYVVTLVPVIGLVQVGEQAMADRYTYIPLIGVFVAVVWGASDVLGALTASRNGRIAAIAAAGLVIVALAAGTWVQTGYWRDSESLFTRARAATSDNHVAELNLAVTLDRGGESEAARLHYEEALRLQPDWPEALYNYGVLLGKTGDLEEAAEVYRRAVRARPSYAEAHYNLAMVYDDQKKLPQAIREYKTAVRLAPDAAPPRNNLAIALYTAGRYREAWEQVRAARALGFEPHPGFLSALSAKMPEPM